VPGHLWEDVTDELSTWMENTPDELVASIAGDAHPFQPAISHEQQMAYHVEHLYPPQLGGAMDTSYLTQIMTRGTEDEVKALGAALDRHVEKRAKEPPPPPGLPAGVRRGGTIGPAGATGGPAPAPFPHLRQPAVLPPPPRAY
jgi:hypothetical protein